MAAEVQVPAAEQLLGALLIESGPLELEEEQGRLDRRLLLLDPLQQRTIGRVGRIGREAQGGVVAAAADEFVDLGQLGHRRGEARRVEPLEPAGVAPGELPGAAERL